MSQARPAPSPDTERLIVGLAAVSRMIRARDPSVVRMGQLAEGLGLAGAMELVTRADDAAQRIAASARP